MSHTRSKIRSKKWVKPESSIARDEMEWPQYLLKQAAKQCRLFGKVAEFVYNSGETNKEETASNWTTNDNNEVILDNGNHFPIQSIQNIYLI